VQRGVPLEVRDLFKRPLARDELLALASRTSVSELFSWKSRTARQLGLTPGSKSDDELVELMAGEPRLIRRPITVTEDRILIGADLKALGQFVSP
jgi:arsenate reductase-like glutaredoxin family protein